MIPKFRVGDTIQTKLGNHLGKIIGWKNGYYTVEWHHPYPVQTIVATDLEPQVYLEKAGIQTRVKPTKRETNMRGAK